MNGDSLKDFLDKYGYPISEEGGPKLKKHKKPSFDWLNTPKFYTPEEAKEKYGYEIEEGWQLKLSPADNDEGFTRSLINPQGWELLQDQSWMSPEGEKYSPDEMTDMLAKSYYPSETEYTGLPPMTPERYQGEKKAYEFEEVLGNVFPDRDIDELNKWLGESDANMGEFLFDIREVGRDPETESLLKTMFKGLGEEEIGELFNEPLTFVSKLHKPLAQMPIGSYKISEQPFGDVVRLIEEDMPGFQLAMAAEGRTPATEDLLRKLYPNTYNKIARDVFLETPAWGFVRGEWLPDAVEDYWKLYWSGVGMIGEVGAGVSERIGANGIVDSLTKIGLAGQTIARDVEMGEPGTPEWYAKNLTRMAPTLLALIDASLATAGGAMAVAGASGAGSFLQSVVGAITAGAVSTIGEGAMEAGDAYNEAKRRGYSIEERNAVFDKVMRENAGLLSVSNTAQFGLAFMLPGGATASLITKGLIYGFEVASEGLEEGWQLQITRGALGDVQKFDEELWQNVKLGLAGGLGFAGVSAVYNNIQSRIENKLTDDQRIKLRDDVSKGVTGGLSQAEATSQAWDNFAQTDEGAKLIDETVNEMRNEEDVKNEEIVPEIEETIQPALPEVDRNIGDFVEEIKESKKTPEMELPKAGLQKGVIKVTEKGIIIGEGLDAGSIRKLKEGTFQVTPSYNQQTKGLKREIFKTEQEAISYAREIPSVPKVTPEIKPTIPKVEPTIPKAEVGMPEAGLQRGMFGEAKEVRPVGKGKVTQISMEEQLKLEQARRAEGLSGIEKRITEIDKLLETKGRLPKGKGTKLQLRIERARLEAERDIAEIDSLEGLRSAREEIERELGNRSLPYHGGAGAGVYSGWITPQLDEMVKVYREAEARLTGEPVTEAPPVEPEVKSREVEPYLPGTSLSINQIDATLKLFAQAITSPDVASQRLATIELRKHHLAQRAHDYAARVEALIIEGKSPEEAMNLSRQEIMSGKLPEVTTEYYSDLTQEMRDVLFAKVHHYWKVVEPDTFEEISATTALTNALAGKSISRKRGTGTRAFPQGGSAWDRLARTFADQPQILQAIDKGKSLEDMIEGIFIEAGRKPLPLDKKTVDYLKGLATLTEVDRLILEKPLNELKVEEVRRIADQEYYRRQRELRAALDEGRIDQVEYNIETRIAKDKIYPYPAVTRPEAPARAGFGQARLGEEKFVAPEISERKTAEQIAKETAELELELAPPPSTVTRFEPPIDDAFEQLPMLTTPEKQTINRVFKELLMSPIDIGNAIRANLASCDMSFLRQVKTLAVANPVELYRSNIEAWKSLFSEKSSEANGIWVRNRPSYPYYANMVERTGQDFLRLYEAPKGTSQWQAAEEFGYLTQERVIPRWTAKIPWIKWAGRAFVTGTNTMTILVYDKCLASTMRRAEMIASGQIKLKEGEAFDIQTEMDDYGKAIAWMTQRASLGKMKALAPELNALFFSARSKLGRFLTPKLLIDKNPRVRAFAWKNLSLFVGVIAAFVMLGKLLDLWDVETDPKNAEFMSIRMGNMRIDPWSGNRQFLVLYTRLITGTGVSSVTGKEYEANPINALQSFFRSSLAPFSSIILDFWTGKNFLGEEVNVTDKEQWLERLAPFAVQDIWEAYEDDWKHGAIAVIPAIFGEGVQTYTGDWVENWAKLGLPKYLENTAYGLNDPKYTTKDFWKDTASQFTGVDPDTLTAEKGYPDYIRAIVEARKIIEQMGLMPNVKLTSINTDPNKGYTLTDYYQMWQDREKIIASGDTGKLNEFDADDITKYAFLGNMTQSQYALLIEYHLLPEKEQKQFLESHPEIGIDHRDEWLKSHPEDNARLAVWGKAKLLSKEAYDYMQKMIKELDIPESGLPEMTLPPEGSVEGYFEYREAGNEYGYNSAEAKLPLVKDDVLRKWLGLQPITTPIESLELQVKWRDESDKRDAWGNRESPLYIVDDGERQTKYDEQYANNPDFRDDMRRVEGYGYEFPDDQIENYVEYYNLPEKGYEQERYLIANGGEDLANPTGFYKAMIDLKDKVPFDLDYKVPDAQYDVISHEWEELFEEYENVIGTESERELAREAILRDNPEFRKARRRREAYGKFIPEERVEDYVEYYEIPPKSSDDWYDRNTSEVYYEDDWFLMEHPEFYAIMIDPEIMGEDAWQPRNFEGVPTRDVFKKYKRYKDMESVKSRLWYRCHNEELDDWLVDVKGLVPAYGTDRCLFNQ